MPNRFRYRAPSFGVLEILLSVAILAVFAAPVLQLFLQASKEEKQARMTDTAVAASVSYVEEFRAGTSPFALSKRLGGSPDADGLSYRRQTDLGGGVTATVAIRRDGADAGGSVYAIDVSVSGRDSGPLYQLSGLQYFGR